MRQSAVLYAVTTCPQFVTFNGSFAEWPDTTTPRTEEPARFFYHWERGVGLSHAGNVCAPWGRSLYIPR